MDTEAANKPVEMMDTGAKDGQGRAIVRIPAASITIDGYNLRQHIDQDHVNALQRDLYRTSDDHDGRRQEVPIVITKDGKLRQGEHRVNAAAKQSEESGQVVYLRAVVDAREDEGEVLLSHIRENMDTFRRNWSESEKGNAIIKLRTKMKDADIARELGMSQSAVSNAAKVAKEAVKPLQILNSQGVITAAQLREVVSVASKGAPRKKLPDDVQTAIFESIQKLRDAAKDVKGREFGHQVDEVFGKARLAFDGTVTKSPGKAPKGSKTEPSVEEPKVGDGTANGSTPTLALEPAKVGGGEKGDGKSTTPLDPRAGLLEMVRDMSQKYELGDIMEALASQYGFETLEHNLAVLACAELGDEVLVGDDEPLVDDDETVAGSHEEE